MASRTRGRVAGSPKRPRVLSESRLGYASRYVRPEEITHVDVKVREYENGLKVVSEHVQGAASVAVGLWVQAGSRHESARSNGIAHFIEHMVFKGTAGKSMREIMRSVESRGGVLNAFTTKEHTCYYAWTRTPYLAEATGILFELATRPNFTEKDIEREKSVVIEEINGIEDEPDELVFDHFEHHLFGKHPLAMPIIGTEKSVKRFARKDLLRFHQLHYRASDITIVASGAQSHDELFAAIDEVLHHLPRHRKRTDKRLPRFPRKPGREKSVERSGGQQAHIIIGRRAPGINAKEYQAINAVVTLLGVGMSSRLNLRLREELGLAYDASSFYSPFSDAGTVGAYVATATENYDRAVKEMSQIIRSLRTRPISAAELKRTKEQMIGGLVLSMESVTTRMMRTGNHELYYGRYLPLQEEIQRIEELTLEEIREVASELFEDESDLIRVSVVPEQEE